MLISEQDRLKDDVSSWLSGHGNERSNLIPLLIHIQGLHSYISKFAVQHVARAMDLFPTDVESVVSFYRFLSRKPGGTYRVSLCRTISCDLAGKDQIAHQLSTELQIKFGETTEDKLFSLEWVNCIGMCDQGPALMINDQVFTKVTVDTIHDLISMCRARIPVVTTVSREV